MAGDGHGHGVGGTGSGYGTGSFGAADGFGYGVVGAGFSARNFLKGFPDLALKGGCANVERESGIGFATFEEAGEADSPLGECGVIAAAGGEGEFAHEALLELGIVVGELDGADTFVGGGDEHASRGRTGDGAAEDGVANHGGDGSAAVFFWSHAELRGGALVEAAAGAVSGGVEGGGDVVSGLEILFHLAQAAGVDVGLGRDSESGLEGALEMEGAEAEFLGEQGEGDAVFNMLLDVATDGANERGLGISIDGFGAAAKAGAESGALGLERVVVEGDVLAARTLGGTGGAAEDSGAGDGEDKRAIVGGLAREDSLPADVVGGQFGGQFGSIFFSQLI